MTTSSLSEYRHRPLEGDEIRLVSIDSYDDATGTLECSLIHCLLEEYKFNALSYVWGDLETTEQITLEDCPFKVTKNLAHYLRVLLWADAICINQKDTEERNRQVKRMRDIYFEASAVLAWLGDSTESTELTFDWITTVSAAVGATTLSEAASSGVSGLDRELQRLADHDDPSVRNGVITLYDNPWWKRMWVIQEAVTARKLLLLCGPYTMSYDIFAQSWRAFYQFIAADAGPHLVDVETNFDASPSTILHIKTAVSQGRDLYLTELLRFARFAKASSPKDKVYAILGLACAADLVSKLIEVEYNDDKLPLESTYAMVVKAHIESYQTLDILESCELKNPQSQVWPSWIPDWSDMRERQTEFSWCPGFLPKQRLYNACGGIMLKEGSWKIEGDRLHIPGVRIDTIVVLSELAMLSSRTYRSQNQKPEMVLRRWMELLPSTRQMYNFTDETMEDAFKRTVVIDRRFQLDGERMAFHRGYGITVLGQDGEEDQPLQRSLDFQAGIAVFMMVANLRRLAITSQGMIGLVPGATRLGDTVVVLAGSQFPHVVRRLGDDELPSRNPNKENHSGNYRLVGEAYIHGIMDGEMMSGVMDEITLA
ncbi:heterokaryon incompatibility protein-domain-containing protein [Xylariales sp. PMI_506]|nr:heterokaryon incompatibility protein-domain-containing protein [Xylariales sp. PMI_506]